MSDTELEELTKVTSFEEIQNLNLAQWFRLPAYEEMFKERRAMRANAFRPLAFYYYSRVRPGVAGSPPTSDSIPIYQDYEKRITEKGYNLHFSSTVGKLASKIHDMASQPDKL